MERSAVAVTVSVDVLLPGVGSVTPAGTATAAVFATEPFVAVTFAVTVKTNVSPLSSCGSVKPAPSSCAIVGAVVHLLPPTHATAVFVRPAAAGSVSVAPVTVDGPLFVTVIVYVVVVPDVAVAAPSVFAIEKSAVR